MAFCREKNQKLLFKVGSILKFRKFFPIRPVRSRNPQQHALNQRSPAEGKGKGQKLLAQGVWVISIVPEGVLGN